MKTIKRPTKETLEKIYSETKLFLNIKELTKQEQIKRVGVVPYVKISSKIYFAFGIDSNYGELADFGGKRFKGEDIRSTAIRELAEETLYIFNLTPKSLNKCLVATNGENCIFFYKIEDVSLYGGIDELSERFLKNKIFYDKPEYYSIHWISNEKLHQIIKTHTRKITKRIFHSSKILVENEMINTKRVLNELSNSENACYPFMYEKIRNIMYPLYDNLLVIL